MNKETIKELIKILKKNRNKLNNAGLSKQNERLEEKDDHTC